MTVTEMVLADQRPRIIYHREFAWWPCYTKDAGRVWLDWVWVTTIAGHRTMTLNFCPWWMVP